MSATSSNLPSSATPGEPLPSTAAAPAGNKTYTQILKSSVLIGGSTFFNVGLGIVRTKVMAMLLGPGGVGLMGLYSSVIDLAQSIAGMGINSSGVRQIAEAVGSGETARIARTATVLRRISVLLGILGAVLLATLCVPVSRWTFDTTEHAVGVALLGLAVFFRLISAGQEALIHGMRRIGDLARMAVFGSVFGTVLSIVLIYFFREQGVVPSLIGIAAMTLLTSWWYRRKIQIESVPVSSAEMGKEAGALLKLGFAFMASGILMMGAAYAVRIIVRDHSGLGAAGLYQSAWALGGLYVGFILQAMGSDFYPRLTAVASNHPECNRLVNEQAEVSLLLAGPGVVGTLTFAPLVIALFYTAKFGAAVDCLRWICLGMALRVIAWPMGFIVLAKGVQKIFFWTELAATAVNVGLAAILVQHYGLTGAGMAFFGLYVIHGIVIYFVVRRLSGFRWSAENKRIGLLVLSLMGAVFGAFYVLPFWLATTLGTLATILSGIYSVRVLCQLVPLGHLPRRVQQVFSWLESKGLVTLKR
jgi:enterobacterial common antigen flippase